MDYWKEMKVIKDQIDQLMEEHKTGKYTTCRPIWSSKLRELRNQLNSLILNVKGEDDAEIQP